MSQKGKSAYLSLLKIIAIYWVVLIQHNFAPFSEDWAWIGNGELYAPFDMLSPFTRYVTSLSMPLCFCVSGYLLEQTKGLHRGSFVNFTKNKIQRVYIPCVVFGSLFMLIKENHVGIEVISGYQHMWFIFYLFVMYELSWIIIKPINQENKKNGLLTIPVTIIIVSKLIFKYPDNIPYIAGFLLYYSYFVLGYLISHLNIHYRPKVLKLSTITFVLSALFVSFNLVGTGGGIE